MEIATEKMSWKPKKLESQSKEIPETIGLSFCKWEIPRISIVIFSSFVDRWEEKENFELIFLVRMEIQIPSLYPPIDWGISETVLIGRALNECLSFLFPNITQPPPARWKVNGNKFFVINLKQFRLCHNAIMRRCRIEQWNFYHNQYRERGKQWIIAAMSTDVDFVI